MPDVPLLKIFSFLDAFSLLQASQVNRVNAIHDQLWDPPRPPPKSLRRLLSLQSLVFHQVPVLGEPSLGPIELPSLLTFALFQAHPISSHKSRSLDFHCFSTVR